MSRVLFVRSPTSEERGLAYVIMDEIVVVNEHGQSVGKVTGADDRGMLRLEITDHDLAAKWTRMSPGSYSIEGRVRPEPAQPARTVKS